MDAIHRAEETLRQSDGIIQALLEAAPDAMVVIDPSGKIVLANSQAEAMFGYAHAELLGQPEEVLMPTRFRQHHQGHREGYFVSPHTRQMGMGKDLWGQRKDGTEFPVEISLSPLATELGTLVFSSIRDSTEQRKADQALRVSEIRYRRLFETAHDGVLLLDPQTRKITDANPYMTTLLGYPHDQLVGKELFEIGLLSDAAASQEMVQTLKETHLVRYEDLPLRSQGGRRQEVEVVANLYDENGHPVIQCNIRDITERKVALEQIENLNIRLRRAVAEAQHRIKNNLQMLSALVELQLPATGAMVPSTELKRIGNHIRTLAALHDLMTVDSHMESGRDIVSLKAALETLVPMLQATSGGRTIRLSAEEMTISLKLGGSFTLLVNELVSNALKHGKGEITVALTRLPGSLARLAVSDQGPGFPPDFDPLTAANTGLELIESMGRWDLHGEVVYENLPGEGAQIILTFPLPELESARG
jgi:PAS domain S-box-containing protein